MKADRIVAFRDFTLGGLATAPQDPHGHGTHVAGIIAGDKSEALGVATKVNLVGLRVLDANGSGVTSNVIAAVQWAVANRAKYRIGVINLSLGHPIYEPAATDPLVQAVEAAVRAGVVVVTSAGNFGKNPDTKQVGFAGITSPGNAPSSITVGAVNTFNTTRRTDDVIADYSSRGPTWFDGFVKPDIVAPGHKILSVASPLSNLYLSYPNLRGPSIGTRKYMYLSGASMASGVVSGAVALILEAAKTTYGAAPPAQRDQGDAAGQRLPDERRGRRHLSRPGAGSRCGEPARCPDDGLRD